MSGIFGFEVQNLFKFLFPSSCFLFYFSLEASDCSRTKGCFGGASGDTPKRTVRLLISQGHLRHAARDQTPGEVRQQPSGGQFILQ